MVALPGAFALLAQPASAITGMDGRVQGEPRFVEADGRWEFSGRVIVRPIQLDAQRALGFSNVEAQRRVDSARDLVATLPVREHVWQTDEYIVEVPDGRTENELAESLMATGLFQYVEPDWIVYPLGDCTDDSRIGQQWHHGEDIMNSCAGWEYFTGSEEVSVGICDTGLRASHEDFQLYRLEGYNAVDQRWENSGGDISDINGHGTATTGCAAANGNNGIGIAGVGWNLSHRIMKVSNDPSGGASLSTLQHAARTAVESGDRVASVSYSGVDNQSNLTTATYIKDLGGLLIWSAGNDSRELTLGDRDDDDIIVVGATDRNDRLAGFSAYGPFVDVVAPGVDVYTTNHSGNSGYGPASGTSFSCPLTAGLAALMWSYKPGAEPDQVMQAIKDGCDDLGESGVDDNFGYGRISTLGGMIAIGEPLRLGVTDPLRSREFANFDVAGCIPNEEVHVFYSLRGPGECAIPEWGVVLDIRNCVLALTGTADNGGLRTWRVRMPYIAERRRIMIQAAQDSTNAALEMKSNVEMRWLEPR